MPSNSLPLLVTPHVSHSRHRHPHQPDQRSEHAVHNHELGLGASELQPKPAVDGPQGDEANAQEDVHIRHARAALALLVETVVERAGDGLEEDADDGHDADDGVVGG